VCIAILVAMLWSCIIGEHVIARRGEADAAETMRAMRALRMNNRREPAASPAGTSHRRPRAHAG